MEALTVGGINSDRGLRSRLWPATNDVDELFRLDLIDSVGTDGVRRRKQDDGEEKR